MVEKVKRPINYGNTVQNSESDPLTIETRFKSYKVKQPPQTVKIKKATSHKIYKKHCAKRRKRSITIETWCKFLNMQSTAILPWYTIHTITYHDTTR